MSLLDKLPPIKEWESVALYSREDVHPMYIMSLFLRNGEGYRELEYLITKTESFQIEDQCRMENIDFSVQGWETDEDIAEGEAEYREAAGDVEGGLF